MELAVVMNTHVQYTNIVLDTIDSIRTYATDNVLVVVDGAAWPYYRDLSLPVHKMQGFRHGHNKSPYRNVALGLKMLTENWPESDWYCYCEYDVLFASERFKANLKMAEEKGVWMLGNDGHIDEHPLPLISSMIGEKLRNSYYLIGCCQFFHRNFIQKLNEINFFDRFLHLTSGFSDGFFPAYSGYDISENLYPTLCRQFGGNIGVFATWDGSWHGASQYFPIRWRPELDAHADLFERASILHPVKNYDSPVREYHRKRREEWKASKKKEKSSG
jgi:hypothetical protein